MDDVCHYCGAQADYVDYGARGSGIVHVCKSHRVTSGIVGLCFHCDREAIYILDDADTHEIVDQRCEYHDQLIEARQSLRNGVNG